MHQKVSFESAIKVRSLICTQDLFATITVVWCKNKAMEPQDFDV